ncbi:MBL fold metallo-hydrolase [Rhodococcus sp. G-MC3]|uniref:MBL fold metallo-hydrolase n=1 Tax=Rhodococcus sp. G-MC3 TaxID=3046209 RepID=UPI0024BA7588|nr:MBL fold metallo-hydrolase [Rhodococcus sp. G-MC3]MDJ0396753.1 MBL fold metallo-hydrolase [Rhodococcus sp. G-MC3]
MRIHHLNCATFAPLGGRLISERHRGFGPAPMVTHCLLLETDAGLVLVDTGLGRHDVIAPKQSLHFPFVPALRPSLLLEETAAHQITQLGYSLDDVRHIVLTHLDLDHAGGLRDFPHARVHVSATELSAARHPENLTARRRYVGSQFDHKPAWVEHSDGGQRWFGFTGVRELSGLPSTIVAVPLPGHTRGHCGIAIDTGSHDAPRWLLHAGDSYFSHTQLDAHPSCPPLLAAFQVLVQVDRNSRLDNLSRLREVATRDDVDVICAHDPHDLAQSIRRQQNSPPSAPDSHTGTTA